MTTAAAEGRCQDHLDIDAEQADDRPQRALGLAKRLMEDQAKRQSGLDRDVGIDRLAAAFSGRRSMPCRHGFLRDPDREAAAPDQGGVILRPVRHPVFRFRDLVPSVFIELIRHAASSAPGTLSKPAYSRSAEASSPRPATAPIRKYNLWPIRAPTPRPGARRTGTC